jgi:hypothetical protein
MSTNIGIDIRYPIGVLFGALGLVIGGYGIATNGDAARYASLGGLNVNLWWGVVMLAFGLLCIVLARRSRNTPTVRPALESAEGKAIEQSEKQRGLERNP